MIEVTKEQFFAYVGPRDIVTSPERDYVTWETRSRVQVGKSTPGYMCKGPKVWWLSETAFAALKEARVA